MSKQRMSKQPMKLKGCPFCGSVPKLSLGKIAAGWWQIECIAEADKCGVYLYTVGQTEEEAAARWNQRATIDAEQGCGQCQMGADGAGAPKLAEGGAA